VWIEWLALRVSPRIIRHTWIANSEFHRELSSICFPSWFLELSNIQHAIWSYVDCFAVGLASMGKGFAHSSTWCLWCSLHYSFPHQAIDTSSETSAWPRTVLKLDKVVLWKCKIQVCSCLHFCLLDNLWGVLGEWGSLWVFTVIHLWFFWIWLQSLWVKVKVLMVSFQILLILPAYVV
jgi:hypothetical protein